MDHDIIRHNCIEQNFAYMTTVAKVSKLWDANFIFNYLKQIYFYLNVLRTYLCK